MQKIFNNYNYIRNGEIDKGFDWALPGHLQCKGHRHGMIYRYP